LSPDAPREVIPLERIGKAIMRAFLSVLTLVACAASAHAADARPNIVVFLVDDMGVMDTSVPFLADANGRPHRLASRS
jgi:hypothetical protein